MEEEKEKAEKAKNELEENISNSAITSKIVTSSTKKDSPFSAELQEQFNEAFKNVFK